MPAPFLTTKRLLLRPWKGSDREPFQQMNQDPQVMEFFPALLSHEQSDTLMKNIQRELIEKPYGFWAVELKNQIPFMGFVGLHEPTFEAAFTPCIEIGWRLSSQHWGKGYAYEAAQKILDYAFNDLGLEEIVSFTAKINKRSIKLMKKLGMQTNPNEDFDHPKVKEGNPLKRHVLYRLKKSVKH